MNASHFNLPNIKLRHVPTRADESKREREKKNKNSLHIERNLRSWEEGIVLMNFFSVRLNATESVSGTEAGGKKRNILAGVV